MSASTIGRDADRPLRLLLVFGAASLAAVAAGAFAAASNGVPAGLWARNLGAWAVGAVIAAGLARGSDRRFWPPVVLGAGLLLAATLLFAGLQGVHRWINVGPLRLNVAELVLPAAAVAWAGLAAEGRRRGAGLVVVAAAIAAVLVSQPDASQAAAWGAAVVGAAALSRSARERWVLAAILLLAAVAAALRPDPLAPVPEVEGIVGLALRTSPWLALAAVASLAAAVAAPALLSWSRRGAAGPAGLALSLLLGTAAGASAVGAFPVPLVGMGVSPIVGAWLGVGLLAARARP